MAEPSQLRKLDISGHRSDVRTVCFSSDNTAILSASHKAVKIWNRSSQTCIRTMPSGYGLCGCFVPGDRHVVVGTKVCDIVMAQIDMYLCLCAIFRLVFLDF